MHVTVDIFVFFCRCSNVTLELVLLDENDNAPSFKRGTINEVSVREDAAAGTTIAFVQAKDKDSKYPVAYVLVSTVLVILE